MKRFDMVDLEALTSMAADSTGRFMEQVFSGYSWPERTAGHPIFVSDLRSLISLLRYCMTSPFGSCMLYFVGSRVIAPPWASILAFAPVPLSYTNQAQDCTHNQCHNKQYE